MSSTVAPGAAVALFPDVAPQSAARSKGILPSQGIRELIRGGRVSAVPAIEEQHIQPAEPKQQPFSERLLAKRPRRQRSERPDHVRHTMAATCRCGSQAEMREHRVDMDNVEMLDVAVNPLGKRA